MLQNRYAILPIVLFLLQLLLFGCVAPTKQADSDSVRQEESVANDYFESGAYLEAANAYLKLADRNSGKADYYNIRAANAQILGGDLQQAGLTLDKLADAGLNPVFLAEKNILLAKIALYGGNAELALQKLETGLPAETPQNLQGLYYTTLAEAQQANGQYINALYTRDQYGRIVQDPVATQDNNNAIWNILGSLTKEQLQQERQASRINFTLAGWIDLAMISRTQVYDRSNLENILQNWNDQYPGHPAFGDITSQVLSLADRLSVQPAQIALLLPFNEQYKSASAAIREGFMAAWYADIGNRPVIRIYDTSAGSIRDIYRSAVTDGAEFIVGPLQKESVAELVNFGDITVKTLALNQVETASEGSRAGSAQQPGLNLFQFGLLPEDEALQAAERAYSDGHRNALVITPDSLWGNRIYQAFSQRWQELGGTIKSYVRLAAGTEDYSEPVRQLLNIDQSIARAKQLIATLSRPVISEPRFRRDADMIFLAATPDIARQLVPQFRFYRADSIPTYSLSSIYSGVFNKQVNRDIDNIIFSDMPWLLSTEYEYSPMQQSLNRTWTQNESPYRRLYALGVDAYQIIPELGRLLARDEIYNGKTGKLSITSKGIVHRKSVWAQFIDGEPQLLDTH